MAQISKGEAIVWGVSTTNMTGFSAAVSGGYTFTGEDLSFEATKDEFRDESGDVKTVVFRDGRKTLSLKCYPSATSGSTASATTTPLAGEEVTLVSGDSDYNGEWICESCTKSRKQDGIVEFDISLIKYDELSTGTSGQQDNNP